MNWKKKRKELRKEKNAQHKEDLLKVEGLGVRNFFDAKTRSGLQVSFDFTGPIVEVGEFDFPFNHEDKTEGEC